MPVAEEFSEKRVESSPDRQQPCDGSDCQSRFNPIKKMGFPRDVEEFNGMFLSKLRRWSTTVLCAASLAGCTGLVDSHYEHTQKLRTELAYLKFWWTCEEGCSADYKKGWKAGYLDVITGGDGQPPMFAPHCYWKPSQILKHGDKNRQEWYTGFQDGAMMASLQPDTHYLKVWNPPACPPGGYYALESTEGTHEPNPAPPSDSPGLIQTPMNEAESPMAPMQMPPILPGGGQLPPVPERPMPLQ
jgi:hypothetical protein